jgi:hypothetical protein
MAVAGQLYFFLLQLYLILTEVFVVYLCPKRQVSGKILQIGCESLLSNPCLFPFKLILCNYKGVVK